MTKPLIIGVEPKLSKDQQDCVDVLEEALTQARAGKIHTLGMVACMERGYATIIAGPHAADLNLGCDSLKRKILDSVEK